MTHIYDWSKLDAGWRYSVIHDALLFGGSMMLVKNAEAFSGGTECDQVRFATAVKAQLAKCRVQVGHDGDTLSVQIPSVDNTPLFEAMDKMAAEVPAEEWAKVPPISNCVTERFGCTPCPACGKHGLHLCEKFYPEPPSTKWFHPSQPWCRGPLAAWTLVNISNHDGRLTVVMRRGRSEVLIETGPDDETLWERLGMKAVEADKAKSKEKCDV